MASSSGSWALVAEYLGAVVRLFLPFSEFVFVGFPVTLVVFADFLETLLVGVAVWLGRGVVVACSVSRGAPAAASLTPSRSSSIECQTPPCVPQTCACC